MNYKEKNKINNNKYKVFILRRKVERNQKISLKEVQASLRSAPLRASRLRYASALA